MADQKISALSSGAPLEDADEFVLRRGAANYKVSLSDLKESVFLTEVTPYEQITSTQTVFTGPCELAGYDVVSATPTPTITIYDGTDDTGDMIVPTTNLSVGRAEFTYKRALITGCHVVISGTATVNVLVG